MKGKLTISEVIKFVVEFCSQSSYVVILTLVATLYNILVLCCLSHISGVMVSMFASSAVDHKFEHLSGQAKNNKVGF
jgi:hypothetical protein